MNDNRQNKPKKNKKIIWNFVFVIVAALTVWAVTAQNKTFSFEKFYDFITSANPLWLTGAFLFMLGFIIFEACALKCFCREFGYRRSLKNGYIYSAADIYFSAITPSATGGQPACAYFMMKDGLSGTFVAVTLLGNLAMYTLSIITIGLVCFVFAFPMLGNFGTVSIILIAIGAVLQIAMLFGFTTLIFSKSLLRKICLFGLKLLNKLHLLKNYDEKRENLSKKMDEYSEYAAIIRGKNKMLVRVFLFNLAQRFSLIMVTVCSYLATGGKLAYAFKIFATQAFVVLGSNCMPIPGAMVVTDYLMLDGFEEIMESAAAVNLELLSRSLSFYICIIICGVSVLIKYLMQKSKEVSR